MRTARDANKHVPTHGFTLLEVLVAFAIAAPALVLLFGQAASSATAARRSSQYLQAVSRARSRLAAVSETTLQPGERSGDEGDGYHWRTRIVALGTAPARPGPQRPTPYAFGTTLFAVTVELTWPGSGATGVTLETRRLGPAAGNTP